MVTLAALAVLGSWALLIVVGAVNDLVAVLRARRFRHSATLLTRVMFGLEVEAEAASEALMRMPREQLIRSLQSLSADLCGDARERLKRLVATVGLRSFILRRARTRVSWRRRVQAAELAHLLPAGDPVRRQLLGDPHPMVRARALDGMEADEVVADVDLVMGLLRDEAEPVRVSAQRAMLSADSRIVPHVIAALGAMDGEVLVPLLAAAASLPDPRLAEAVSGHAASDDPVRRALVAEALGGMRSARGVPVLHRLLDDPEPIVRRAAVGAVATTRGTELAGRVGRLLGDADWDVRSAAANCLGDLGPVGWMVLRQALWSPFADAVAVARLALDQVAAAQSEASAMGPERLAAYGEDIILELVA